jgi:hypothetical protein
LQLVIATMILLYHCNYNSYCIHSYNVNVTLNYNFIKSVEQIIGYRNKASLNNTTRILLPTTNYIDYSIPYFTGYPMEFAIYGLTSTNTY